MAELTPTITDELIRSCRAGLDDIGASMASALGGVFTLGVGEVTPFNAEEPPDGFDGPGLAMLFRVGDVGLVAILPEASGHLPTWYGEPDATGKAKLATLAQELSLLILPDRFNVDEFSAAAVANCARALKHARVAAGSVYVSIEMKQGERRGELCVLWPLAEPANLWRIDEPACTAETDSAGNDPSVPPAAANPGTGETEATRSAPPVPTYAGNVLKITIPVTVVLASQRKPIREIVELGPGSIVKFEKTCDQPLELCIEDRRIAVGEVVKVGDKFGLKIAQLGPAEAV